MEEEWKDIKGYEGRYLVSNLGRVKSTTRNREKILKQNTTGNKRYATINFILKRAKKTFLVHRLVALAFIPNPENKPQVNHIDGNRLNNRVDNLQWNTASENNIHAYRTKLNKAVGERHPRTGLLNNEVRAIRLLHGIKTLEEMSIFFGISKSAVSGILRGRTWKYLDD